MTAPGKAFLIREYETGDQSAFQKLNEEWIVRHFGLESKDVETLTDPEGKILLGGGRIFFAVRDRETVGCCALVPTGPREFEVAKMAVTQSARGIGAGRRLLETAIEQARRTGATRLYLETNHILTPAIRLYESVGFRHIPTERVTHSPYARADVYMELLFEPNA